jgi:hypothetical protein
MDANGQYARVQPSKAKRPSIRAKQADQPVQAHGAQAALMGLYAAKL